MVIVAQYYKNQSVIDFSFTKSKKFSTSVVVVGQNFKLEKNKAGYRHPTIAVNHINRLLIHLLMLLIKINVFSFDIADSKSW